MDEQSKTKISQFIASRRLGKYKQSNYDHVRSFLNQNHFGEQ